MIKELYTELCTVLSAVDDVKYIDLWNEQPFYEDREVPFPKVSLFLEFTSESFSDLGNNGQLADMQVSVYVLYKTMGESRHTASRQEEALGFLDVLQNVHKALQGIQGEHYGKASRT